MISEPMENLRDPPRNSLAALTGGRFEMVHGTLSPGGHAARHHHDAAFQAMLVLAGAANVALGGRPTRRCGPGDIIRIPPGLAHQVTSLGPDALGLVIVHSPPISA